MKTTKIYSMPFGKIYQLYKNKITRRHIDPTELDAALSWLTGYSVQDIAAYAALDIDLEHFFLNAPKINPDRFLIKGKICGIDPFTLADPLLQTIRYTDKLVDELSKGKTLDEIIVSIHR